MKTTYVKGENSKQVNTSTSKTQYCTLTLITYGIQILCSGMALVFNEGQEEHPQLPPNFPKCYDFQSTLVQSATGN